jgi:hypothetical protein
MILELSTPKLLYCCNAQCAKFLLPRVIVGDVGTCAKCRSQTCRHCRRPAHPRTFCGGDKEIKAVEDLEKQKGWKMCPGCNHLIQRQSGCLHMICPKMPDCVLLSVFETVKGLRIYVSGPLALPLRSLMEFLSFANALNLAISATHPKIQSLRDPGR